MKMFQVSLHQAIKCFTWLTLNGDCDSSCPLDLLSLNDDDDDYVNLANTSQLDKLTFSVSVFDLRAGYVGLYACIIFDHYNC